MMRRYHHWHQLLSHRASERVFGTLSQRRAISAAHAEVQLTPQGQHAAASPSAVALLGAQQGVSYLDETETHLLEPSHSLGIVVTPGSKADGIAEPKPKNAGGECRRVGDACREDDAVSATHEVG